MRIGIVAAGGIGGFLAVRLIEAGHEVGVVARGANLDAIRGQGLTLVSGEETITARPAVATDDPSDIGPVEVVVFAVKLGDTETAARACRPLLGADTVVVPFQNGVESAVHLSQILGEEHAAAGACYISMLLDAPGRVRKVGALERFLVAEANGQPSDRMEAFVDALVAAGVKAEIPDAIAIEIWRKFAFLAALSGMTAMCRAPIGVIRKDALMRSVLERAIEEVVAVAWARGIELPEDMVERHMTFVGGLDEEMSSSQAADLAAGKPLEVEGLSGAVVRLGVEAGVDTPVHGTMLAALRPFAAGGAR